MQYLSYSLHRFGLALHFGSYSGFPPEDLPNATKDWMEKTSYGYPSTLDLMMTMTSLQCIVKEV